MLTQTFVGTLFIAVSTSLPELVVAVTALRMGAADMAVGNLFGSNMFNMAILALDDIAYAEGTFSYRVMATSIVEPTDVSVLAASSGSTLTLVACFPFYYVGPAPKRFVVHATMESGPSAFMPRAGATPHIAC